MATDQESLEAFIIRRRQEIDDAEQPLKQQLDALRAERDKLRRAALAIGFDFDAGPKSPKPDEGKKPSRLTLKEAVIQTLAGAPQGLTTISLLDALNAKFSTAYPKASLSPELSRMRGKGLVALKGSLWFALENQPLKEDPDHSLFEQNRSGLSSSDPEAQGVEAAPGGGT